MYHMLLLSNIDTYGRFLGHPQEMDEAPNVPGGDHGGQGVEVTGIALRFYLSL